MKKGDFKRVLLIFLTIICSTGCHPFYWGPIDEWAPFGPEQWSPARLPAAGPGFDGEFVYFVASGDSQRSVAAAAAIARKHLLEELTTALARELRTGKREKNTIACLEETGLLYSALGVEQRVYTVVQAYRHLNKKNVVVTDVRRYVVELRYRVSQSEYRRVSRDFQNCLNSLN
jgi:hypothetical protein